VTSLCCFFHSYPNEFALLALANLAELDDVPIDLLEELFDKGDAGCKVTYVTLLNS
jgi:hypothetical protein